MNFHQDKKRKAQKKFLLAIAGVVLCVLMLTLTPLSRVLSGPFGRMGKIFWKSGEQAESAVSSGAIVVQSKSSLHAKNVALESENADLKLQLADRGLLVKENEMLKGELGRTGSAPKIIATILAKPNRTPYDTLVLDIGSDAGIRNDAVVYAGGEIAIGRIGEVSARTSKVVLYSTPDEKITARLEDKNIDVELIGRGGGNFEISIPRDVVVPEGARILLPSITPTIIATVVKTISDERDPFQKILLQSPVNIQELNYVYIAK